MRQALGVKCLLLAIGLTGPVWSQVICPPDSSILVGSQGKVPFSWPGSAKEYFLQVQTAGKTVFEGKVQGNHISLDLRSNLAYRWNVAPLSGGLGASGDTHGFQLNHQLVYSYDGARGQAPPPKSSSQNQTGTTGGDGGRGQNLTIRLEHGPSPELTRVAIDAERGRATYYLLRDSDPITITARGGDGEEGGSGLPGSPAYLSRTMPQGFVEATSGTDGGRGGRGGQGGSIVLYSNGINWKPRFKFILDGGVGGVGGFAGVGGAALNSFPARGGGGYTGPGASGREGSRGENGRPGALQIH